MEYEINGGINTITGDVERLEAHGGVLYVKGEVGTLVHHGGVMYDQRPSNRVEYRTDKMSDEERWRYKQRISELERKLNLSVCECMKLRDKLAKEVVEQPDDDVLIQRINLLQSKLRQEKEEGEKQRKEVEELKWRLDAVTEIANSRSCDNCATKRNEQYVNDEMFDVLFTFINLFPFTTDSDLSFEFGINQGQVRYIANILRLAKSPEARREAVEYLKRQHSEMIERRGGDQGNHHAKSVEKVARNGKVLKTYKSAKAAAKDCGLCDKTIRDYCQDYFKAKRYTRDGFTFRYKEHKTKMNYGKEREETTAANRRKDEA